jgi:hypothetical protein
MIKINRLKEIMALGKGLTISFVGISRRPRGPASIYTYDGRFSLDGNRLVCPGIDYTRHYSKIIMIRKGQELLFGKRCRKCGASVPKSHGNCFDCYSENIEVFY